MPFRELEEKFTGSLIFHRYCAQKRRNRALYSQRILVYSVPFLSILLGVKQVIPSLQKLWVSEKGGLDVFTVIISASIAFISFILKSFRPNEKILDCDRVISDITGIIDDYDIEKTKIDILKFSANEKDKKKIPLIEKLSKKLRIRVLNFNLSYDKLKMDEIDNYSPVQSKSKEIL